MFHLILWLDWKQKQIWYHPTSFNINLYSFSFNKINSPPTTFHLTSLSFCAMLCFAYQFPKILRIMHKKRTKQKKNFKICYHRYGFRLSTSSKLALILDAPTWFRSNFHANDTIQQLCQMNVQWTREWNDMKVCTYVLMMTWHYFNRIDSIFWSR